MRQIHIPVLWASHRRCRRQDRRTIPCEQGVVLRNALLHLLQLPGRRLILSNSYCGELRGHRIEDL